MAIPLVHETLNEMVQRIAKQRQSSPQAVLEDLAFRYLEAMPLELLDNEQILVFADLHLTPEQETDLAELLEQQREGLLDEGKTQDLATFMKLYGRLQVRKAQAMAEAVKRGLRSASLEDWPPQE